MMVWLLSNVTLDHGLTRSLAKSLTIGTHSPLAQLCAVTPTATALCVTMFTRCHSVSEDFLCQLGLWPCLWDIFLIVS